jgi:hypothetical protein
MVEYGGGISHGPAGQVSGSGGTHPLAGGGSDIGANVSNIFNDAVNTFSAMPLAEQVLLVAITLILAYFLLRRAF